MTAPMNCTQTQNMFSALADNELDAAETGRIKEHLATCPHCAQEWHFFRESLTWLHETESVPAPADLLVGIHAKLEQTNPFIDWLRDLFGSPLRSLSSLTAIAIAIFFWAAPHDTQHQTQPNTIVAARSVAKPRLPGQQLNTISVMNRPAKTWASSPSAPPYHLLAPPTLTPDINITVHTASHDAKNYLYQRLASQNRWQIHPVQNGFLIYLDEQDLHHLTHALAPHRLTLSQHPSPIDATTKKLRTVNLRIETP